MFTSITTVILKFWPILLLTTITTPHFVTSQNSSEIQNTTENRLEDVTTSLEFLMDESTDEETSTWNETDDETTDNIVSRDPSPYGEGSTETVISTLGISTLLTSPHTWTTFPPMTTIPSNETTPFQPSPILTSSPPTWAIVLISIMICFSLILTGLFALRKYCTRRRKEERRYLLSQRSQEGYFFGESSGGTNEL